MPAIGDSCKTIEADPAGRDMPGKEETAMIRVGRFGKAASISLCLSLCLMLSGCEKRESIASLDQLSDKVFAVVTGTVADDLVWSRFPHAEMTYYNTALDAALAVKAGRADAAGYDEPILRNIAAKQPGLMILPERVTTDDYGFAVRLERLDLKEVIDRVIEDIKSNGTYEAMMQRWLPQSGSPAPMPEIPLTGANGVLTLGTAAVTEPFAFIDGSRRVVGFDIELARYVAQKLGMSLGVVNMDFGALIPALISGKVDMIAACITITEERAQSVLFSRSYYTGGISALVRQ